MPPSDNAFHNRQAHGRDLLVGSSIGVAGTARPARLHA